MKNYKIIVDRKDLENLVKGSSGPAPSAFNHPLVIKSGHWYSDQYGRTSWDSLSALSDYELYQLYLICRDKQQLKR
jgi:hypothetical protein